MNIIKELKLNKAINVTVDDTAIFPFNLTFSSVNGYEPDVAKGPGIYFISFNGQVVYIGIFTPFETGNIINTRWIRHLTGTTLRGIRTGFGKNSNNKKALSRRLSYVTNGELHKHITKAYNERIKNHFRDTGYVASLNRIRFADKNWKQFSESDEKTILSPFEFYFIKLGDVEDHAEAKKICKAIESKLINTYFPCWNKEYKTKHNSMQKECTPSKIFSDVENSKINGFSIIGCYTYK